MLAQLFPEIEFQGKAARRNSHFLVRFTLGVALALAGGTECVLENESEACFVLRYFQARCGIEGHWAVSARAEPTPLSAAADDVQGWPYKLTHHAPLPQEGAKREPEPSEASRGVVRTSNSYYSTSKRIRIRDQIPLAKSRLALRIVDAGQT